MRLMNFFPDFGCRNGTHLPSSLLLFTHWVMNNIPSTPSWLYKYR